MNIKKRCNKINCSTLIDISETYCDEHKQEVNRQYDKIRYSTEEGMKYKRFYNSKSWKSLRYQTLLHSGFTCARCGREANIGDHIIPIKVRWDLRLEPSNIQSMCFECHNTKSEEDKQNYNI